jgi:transcriptional regulator with XRE-family HTH domain
MLDHNLKYLRKRAKISQQEFAEIMEVGRTTVGDYERGRTEPPLNLLIRMADYFDVTVDALIRKNISHQDLEIIRNKDFKVLAISVDKNNEGNIELVDTKASAGYLESFQDPEYIKDLPKIDFPNIPQGTFRGFEIVGDSMLPIEPGSIIVCKYIEKIEEVKDGKTYIIVSKEDGLVYKRVYNNQENKSLTLRSDNELYSSYEINYQEIAEIWQYYCHLSFSDSRMTFNNLLEEKLTDIQRKVTSINDKISER